MKKVKEYGIIDVSGRFWDFVNSVAKETGTNPRIVAEIIADVFNGDPDKVEHEVFVTPDIEWMMNDEIKILKPTVFKQMVEEYGYDEAVKKYALILHYMGDDRPLPEIEKEIRSTFLI